MKILGTLVFGALVVAGISGPVAAQQWTADDLYADRPFGNIKVGRAGIGQMDFQAFFDNLSDQQRAEIRSRCAVIGVTVDLQNGSVTCVLRSKQLKAAPESSRVDPQRKAELRAGMQRLITDIRSISPSRSNATASISAAQQLH